MGLYTQQDPIGIAGGLNLYGYANGDPVNYSDPYGLCPDGCVLELALYAAVVGGAAFLSAQAANHADELAAAGQAVGEWVDGTVERSKSGIAKVLGVVGSLLSFNPANAEGPEPPPRPEDDPPPVAPPTTSGNGDGGPRPRLDDGFTLPNGTTVRFIPR
jgi:uncharacterized protein RhaS with RHS repeats